MGFGASDILCPGLFLCLTGTALGYSINVFI